MPNSVCLWFTGLLLSHLFAQSPYPTNQEILEQMLISPALNVLNDTLQHPTPIAIVAADRENLLVSWLVQNLTDSCLSQNYLVYSAADSNMPGRYSVQLSDPRVKIEYRSAGRRLLVFKKGLRRIVEGSYHLQIANDRQQILFSRRIGGSFEDVIPEKILTQVEDEAYPFTRGVKSGNSFVTRWLEPVLITATTATVIYLFYTLRSEE
ncbi:MAG: hypothetical protein D6681_16000 [Calditrichaeota bacterium]|nr:MAG: hypothetical protein D6681_16000 [Calditrichota bacterium]